MSHQYLFGAVQKKDVAQIPAVARHPLTDESFDRNNVEQVANSSGAVFDKSNLMEKTLPLVKKYCKSFEAKHSNSAIFGAFCDAIKKHVPSQTAPLIDAIFIRRYETDDCYVNGWTAVVNDLEGVSPACNWTVEGVFKSFVKNIGASVHIRECDKFLITSYCVDQLFENKGDASLSFWKEKGHHFEKMSIWQY